MRTQTPLKTELFAGALRKVTLRVFAVVALLVIAAATFLPRLPHASAATNGTLNFQARLENASGAIVPDGYYNIQFKLYGAASGGTALWTESYIDTNGATAGNDYRVQVINGYASVNLGSLTAFPGTINWDQDLWLTMNIGGTTQTATPSYDGEMNPRLKLTAVPYAFQAKSATQLQALQGTYAGTLDFNTLTANRSIQLPDEDGTICLQGSSNCGFLTGAAASGSYIQLQGSTPGTAQTGNFNITGTGIAGILQGGQLKAGSSQQFTVDTNGNVQTTGTSTVKTTSTAAFSVQSAGGASVLNVDTQNTRVGIGTATPTALLDIRGSAVIGSEMVTNGSFTGSAAGWTLGDCASYGTNNVSILYDGVCSDPSVSTDITTQAGKQYQVTFDVVATNGDVPYVYLINNSFSSDSMGLGSHTVVFKSDYTGTDTIVFESWNWADNAGWTIDNISVKEVDAAPLLSVTGYDGSRWLQLGDYTNSSIGLGLGALAVNTGQGNSAFGNYALQSNTTGIYNTASGAYALQSNTTGSRNTASGYYALQSNTTGNYNTASGYYALQSNTTGSSNAAFGFSSLYSNTTGWNNTAVGTLSLYYNTIGSNNTASGSNALRYNTTGTENTASGAYALQANTTGNYNTASGAYALQGNTTGYNNTASGAYALQGNTTGYNNTASGYYALYSNTTGYENTASGYYALQSNTTGYYNTASGAYALQSNTTGNNNSAVGIFALKTNTTGSGNAALGYGALQNNTTGNYNTALGTSTLSNNTTGNNNSAVGTSALQSNTIGVNNSAVGTSALKTNTTGSGNAALGYGALSFNTTGNNNSALGNGALTLSTTGSDNTALGSAALGSNTTGYSNSAIGVNALQGNTSGYGNVALGYAALLSNTTGNNNTALGNFAGYWESDGRFRTLAILQNATAIGAYAQVQKDNTLVLGSVDKATQTVVGATVPVGTNLFGVAPVSLNSATVTATQNGTTVTASAPIFSSSNVGEILIWTDGTTDTITGYIDSTHVTVQSNTFRGGDSYFRTHKIGFQVANNGDTYIRNGSTTAFAVQGALGGNVLTANTTGNIIQIGSATTDDTAVLFGLDSYNSGTDPAGFNGAMYYNTSLNKFRCYQGGAWADCIGASGGPTGSYVSLQGGTPGTADAGNFNITGTGIAGVLQSTTLTISGNATFGGTSLVKPTQVAIKNTDGTQRALTLQAASGQSVDLFSMYDAGGSFVSGYDASGNIFANGSLNLGTATSAGTFKLKDGAGFTTTVKPLAQTGSYTISLPAVTANDTLCTVGLANCGGGSGGSYVKLQATTPGTADVGNFNINGKGIANILQGTTSVLTASLDTAAAGTLSIGTTNATTINVGTNAAAHSINIGSTTGASSVNIQGGTGGIGFNIVPVGTGSYYFNIGGTGVMGLSASGDFWQKSTAPSTTAFSIQNASRTVFSVDTQNEKAVAYYLDSQLGISSPNIYLNPDVGGNPTTYVSPQGTNIQSRLVIKTYDPLSYHSQIAAGLPSTASQNATSIALFDARTASHRPTISVYSPDESAVFGLTWDGSNSTAVVKTTSTGMNFNLGGDFAAFSLLQSGTNMVARLGITGSYTGQLQLANSTNSNTATLQAGATSASYTTVLPTAIGTAGQCLYVASVATTTQNLGYTTCGGGGSGSYVSLQATTPGTADVGNFNINGTGIASALRAGSFDTASAGTLSIGAANATTVNVATNNIAHTINIGTGTGAQTVKIGSTDVSSSLILQTGTGGFSLNTSGANSFTSDNIGRVVFKPTSDNAGTFKIQNADASVTIFNVDTSSGAEKITMSRLLQTSAAIETSSYLNMTVGTSTNYHTPAGSDVPTKINIAYYNPGDYGQVLAMGIPSASMSTSRVISLFDARTTAHQPTISVFNPTETDVFGLSWDGSNTLPSLKSSTNSVALQAGGSKLLTANFIGGNTAEAYLGTTGSTTGRVTMTNYGNSNTVSLQSGVTGASYTTNLMTSIGTAGQCLYVASVTGSIQDLGYTSCAGSGSGSGVTTVGIFSAASIVNGASISGTTITFGAADGTNPGMVSTIAQTFAGAKTFTGAMLINTTSATALQVQAAGGNALLTADTSAGQVLFGKASALTGKLVIANSTNANTVTITSGATSASYTITLPTSVGGANQCLMNSATPGVLTWGTCGGGSGSGGTQTITLVPEFVGATFSTSDGSGASSGNNTGYMTSDYAKVTSAEGYKHNYYQWYTDQATAQDYHIITQYQLPSNFTSFAAGSWTAWSYRTSTSGSIGYTIYDAQGNSCSSGTLSFSGSASTWYQSAMNSPSTTAPCSFAANDIITIDFKLIAQSPSTNYTRLGEVRFSYN